MRRRMMLFSLVAFFGVLLRATPGFADGPDFEWRVGTPEGHGISSPRLEAWAKAMVAGNSANLLVIRDDTIVHEWYAPGRSMRDKHYSASLAKALVAGMSLAVALTDKQISLDDFVAERVPEWANDPVKKTITIRQLGSHTSGFDNGKPAATGIRHEFWASLKPPRDPFSIARDDWPIRFEPGRQLHYSSPGIGMLTYAVTAAIQNSATKDIRTLLRERIMRPIGVRDDEWSCNDGQTFVVKGLPLVASWGGAEYTPRAAARIARLVLRGGDWEGRQLLSQDAVRQVAGSSGLPQQCGMGWWTNAEGKLAGVPREAIWGWGAGGQYLLIVPSRKLIMVRNGGEFDIEGLAKRKSLPDDQTVADFHAGAAKQLFAPLLSAFIDNGPDANGQAVP